MNAQTTTDLRVQADTVATLAGQIAAVATLMACQADDLGCGSDAARADLTELLELLCLQEGLTRTLSRRAHDLANAMAKQNPGG